MPQRVDDDSGRRTTRVPVTLGPTQSLTLASGATVRLRPIVAADESELTALYARLSPETAYQRFFTLMARLPPDWARILATVDYDQRMAIVAVDPRERLIAVGRYDCDAATKEAEIALVVQDAWQRQGLGATLLTELLRYADARGIRRFRAYVLAENQRMLRMLERLTRIRERRTEAGVTSLLLERRPEPDA